MAPEFLSEMMELNEEVESADADRLDQMLQEVREKESILLQQLSLSFGSKDYDSCKRLLMQLKFYQSLITSIKDKKN